MNDDLHRWRGRRVLVTGCTGLLGSAVSGQLLAAGVDVVGLVREHRPVPEYAQTQHPGRFHIVRGRVEDRFRVYSALAIHEIVALFHLASAEERATTPVLEAAGSWNRDLPVVVARPTPAVRLPTSNARLGIARFGELFGPGDRNGSHIIPATISAHLGVSRSIFALNGPITDFVFANDAARACLQLAELLMVPSQPRALEMTFRSGWESSDRVMAGIVRDVLTERGPSIAFTPSPPNLLDWSPQGSFRDAVKQTADWMVLNREAWAGHDASQEAVIRAAA